jgi:hypothetical protein
MSETIYGLDAATDVAFRAAYIASLPLVLQGLWAKREASNVDQFSLLAEALAIARTGAALVNMAVDGYGSDPLPWMMDMENQGYHSMWNILQPAGSPATYGVPPSQAPPGALLVSSNIADWKPLIPARPVVPFDPSLVGPDLGFQINGMEVFSARAQAHYAEEFAEGGYIYHLMGDSLMNPSQRTGVWLKQ